LLLSSEGRIHPFCAIAGSSGGTVTVPGLPYRLNVGAMLFSRQGKVFVGKRAGLHADQASLGWQMPQGGIDADEDPARAVFRELREEIGTDAAEIIGEYPGWLSYDFPPELVVPYRDQFRGQTQRWFALRFTGLDHMIRLDADPHPEFDAWRWVDLSELASLAVVFKRPIYEVLVRKFARFSAS
jgi:putative (di)nucleoside polyphosphate hydrolase